MCGRALPPDESQHHFAILRHKVIEPRRIIVWIIAAAPDLLLCRAAIQRGKVHILQEIDIAGLLGDRIVLIIDDSQAIDWNAVSLPQVCRDKCNFAVTIGDTELIARGVNHVMAFAFKVHDGPSRGLDVDKQIPAVMVRYVNRQFAVDIAQIDDVSRTTPLKTRT